MFLLDPQNTSTIHPENCNIPEEQDGDIKIVFVNMIETLREKIITYRNLRRHKQSMKVNE